ncbi:MAG: pitrilysin family protein [Rikenellaceae bacterium]
MITYEKKILQNGLTVLFNKDVNTPMAAVNTIYKVGSRNEFPDKTGFAHLFEHLMFGGSKNVPQFDIPLQEAAGEDNAFTNDDYTNYYEVLPKENIETALWVESDRMRNLNINKETLALQQKVVVEEFKQRYLNQPYGDLNAMLRDMAFKVHPYRWLTIGKDVSHIENATLSDVQAFYDTFYQPDNAIIGISGDFESDEIFALVEKWFGDIKGSKSDIPKIPQEPKQEEARRMSVSRDVSASAIYIVFKMSDRLSYDYILCDTISDILSSGNSSRLYRKLVVENPLFSNINAYISGNIDPSLFVVCGYLSEGVTVEDGEKAMVNAISEFCDSAIEDTELEKVKNKFEANTLFGELNVSNKAMNLCYYEMIGDISLINSEIGRYRGVTPQEITTMAKQLFRTENSSTLIYKSDNDR